MKMTRRPFVTWGNDSIIEIDHVLLSVRAASRESWQSRAWPPPRLRAVQVTREGSSLVRARFSGAAGTPADWVSRRAGGSPEYGRQGMPRRAAAIRDHPGSVADLRRSTETNTLPRDNDLVAGDHGPVTVGQLQ